MLRSSDTKVPGRYDVLGHVDQRFRGIALFDSTPHTVDIGYVTTGATSTETEMVLSSASV